jgi:hypothetical protein
MANKKNFSFQDYLEYQKDLRNSLENNSETLFFNESYVHAAMVAKTIIDKAVRDGQGINMFCGEFSLFRNGFKQHIDNIKANLKNNDASLENDKAFQSFNPYEELINSLKTFLDNNLKMVVIIANTLSNIKEDTVWPLLKKNIDSKNLIFKKLEVDLGIDHFMVSGSAFRLESSGEDKTAICSINRPEYASVLQTTFNNLNARSIDLSL